MRPYTTEHGEIEFFWVPEAPQHPGVYAIDPEKRTMKNQNCTLSIHEARKFSTSKECDVWCRANTEPAFVPKQHGYCPV
jgi:hypothetical protein